MTTAFDRADLIEASLEMLADRVADPTPLVYEKLFADYPTYRAHFWRDTNGAVKGEMLSRVFAAILDFIGERRYADHMIRCEIVTHEGYDVDREVFGTFFGHVAATVRDVLGEDWTEEMADAWRDLLVELDAYLKSAPQLGPAPPFAAKLRHEFEEKFATG
ncbi:MAG: globin [Caulobacteraceae bacterium]|nr:globin [Caulobacteraceae bacterium]